jgi:hypothetical protein
LVDVAAINCNLYPNAYSNRTGNYDSDTYVHETPKAASDSHANANAYSHCDAAWSVYGDLHLRAVSYLDPQAHLDASGNVDTGTNLDADVLADADLYSYADANQHAHQYAHAHQYPDGDAYAD